MKGFEVYMNSRQRILAALNHREPDKVPIDFGGHRSSGIAALAYTKLRQYLGLPPRLPKVYDLVQQLAIIDEDVLDRFGVDTIEMGRGFALGDEDWVEWRLPDNTPCLVPAWSVPEREPNRWILRSKSGRVIGHMPDGALYFEQTFYPYLEGDTSLPLQEALEECMWGAVSAPPGPVSDERMKEGAAALRHKSNAAIIGLFGGNLLETGQFLFRNDQFFMLLVSEPKRAHAFLDELVHYHMTHLDHFLDLVKDHIDIILFGDDLGMQNGPQISPVMYREFFKPRHQLMWQHCKKRADVKVMLHCCGGVRELLPDLIDAGLDAINPVQISCTGMGASGLEAEFGKDITFWGGGCDTHAILPMGTPKEIAEHVKKQVSILHPGGGFVFQQVHNIVANVPPQNIVAMFDAVRA